MKCIFLKTKIFSELRKLFFGNTNILKIQKELKMAKVAIIGSGMMGSALAFPILENGHEVSLIGTHLDTEIILNARKTGRHLKFEKDFPAGKINYYTIDEIEEGIKNIDYVMWGFELRRGMVRRKNPSGSSRKYYNFIGYQRSYERTGRHSYHLRRLLEVRCEKAQ